MESVHDFAGVNGIADYRAATSAPGTDRARHREMGPAKKQSSRSANPRKPLH